MHDDEDPFDFGNDLGPSAYVEPTAPERGPAEDTAVDAEVGDRHLQQPPAKIARLGEHDVGQESSGAAEAAGTTALVPAVILNEASLCGLEDRLSLLGEAPRFVANGTGGLEHQCSWARASVSFWPCSLQWKVSGIDAERV